MLSPGLLITLIVSSLVLFVVGLPMALGRVAPNPVYGVRLPVTFRSRAAWDAANTHYGWWLLASAVSTFSVILIGWAAGCGDTVVWIWLGVLLVTLIGGLPSTVTLAYRAERRARAETAQSANADSTTPKD